MMTDSMMAMEAKLAGLQGVVRQQQNQIAVLGREQRELQEREAALRTCLEKNSLLAAPQFEVVLHRQRFSAVLEKHPCVLDASMASTLQRADVMINTAKYTGLASVGRLSVISASIHACVREMTSVFPSMFPSMVCLVGGIGDGIAPLHSVERFNPDSPCWEPPSTSPFPRTDAAAAVCNGKVCVIGGDTNFMDVFDPWANSWERVPGMQIARSDTAAVALDSKVFAIGGCDGLGQAVDTCECFNVLTRQWEPVPPLYQERCGLAAAEVDGSIIAAGGKSDSTGVLATAELLDVVEGTWVPLEPMFTARAYAAAVSHGARLYVIGGYDHFMRDLRSMEMFELCLGMWEVLDASMRVPRWGAGAVAFQSSILVFGGSNSDDGPLKSCESFCLKRNKWTELPAMRCCRRACAAAAIGGSSSSSSSNSTACSSTRSSFRSISSSSSNPNSGNF